MSRILVTGASGLLGINFCNRFAVEHDLLGVVNTHQPVGVPFALRQADLTRPGEAARMVAEFQPDWVLHCAALANLETCEKQPDLAERLNADLPGELAEVCAKNQMGMVHISTDAVFDGLHGGYTEMDTPNPINVYARTKLAGEQAVLAAYPQAIVARVNFYGWSLNGQRSLGEFFANNLLAGRRMNGFTDVVFCPLHVTVLAELLMEMVERGLSGVYHVLAAQSISKYDFGCGIAQALGLDAGLITPVSWRAGELAAPRSPDLRLSTAKLAADLGHALPDVHSGITRFADEYQHGWPGTLRTWAIKQ